MGESAGFQGFYVWIWFEFKQPLTTPSNSGVAYEIKAHNAIAASHDNPRNT